VKVRAYANGAAGGSGLPRGAREEGGQRRTARARGGEDSARESERGEGRQARKQESVCKSEGGGRHTACWRRGSVVARSAWGPRDGVVEAEQRV